MVVHAFNLHTQKDLCESQGYTARPGSKINKYLIIIIINTTTTIITTWRSTEADTRYLLASVYICTRVRAQTSHPHNKEIKNNMASWVWWSRLAKVDQLEQHSEKSPQKIQNSGQQDGGSQGKAVVAKSKDLGPT